MLLIHVNLNHESSVLSFFSLVLDDGESDDNISSNVKILLHF